MDISIFFNPVEKSSSLNKELFGEKIVVFSEQHDFPDLDNIDIAIIGVKEERAAGNNIGCSEGPDAIRDQLYQLAQGSFNSKIVDLGNILPGETITDTYFAVSSVVETLVKKNILPVIIGGSQDLTFANYTAYQKLEQTVNLVTIDNQFDLGSSDGELNSSTYLSKIILHQPNYLFNYSNIGYQTYFVNEEAIELMSKLFFDVYRLGEFTGKIQEAEPVIRNADTISFDISAVRMSDAPGSGLASPNGFYAEQACQMARYAGISDKLSSIGFYNYNPRFDNRNQTAQLMAQMIWFVVEGFYNRKKEYPLSDKSSYIKYRVMLEDNKYELTFFKSKKSDRWWMDVPYPPNKRIQFERHHLVPCSYSDYQKALEDEMPDKWWKTYQKLI